MLAVWRRAGRTVLIVGGPQREPALNSAFLHQPNIKLLVSQPDARGLKLARRKRPDLIIEDLQGGESAGLAFCRDLRAHPVTRPIPLILVADAQTRDRAHSANADALLGKPLIRHEYFKAVRRFLPLPKRRTERVPINLRFSYSLDGRPAQAFSRDISQSGAFIRSDRRVEVGRRIQLRFALPGEGEIRCDGVVRFVTPSSGAFPIGGFGVEFDGMSDEAVAQLEEFIERQLQRPLLSL